MIDKSDINQWLESNFLERRFGCVTDKDIVDAFHQCFNDLSDQWVSDHTVRVNSKWVHTNGNEYEVITIANSETMTDRYPVTVIYRNVDNGTIWSRSLNDWHRSMTLKPEPPK